MNIHDKKFIHNDIWHKNICLNEKNKLVIIDFGISLKYDITPQKIKGVKYY